MVLNLSVKRYETRKETLKNQIRKKILTKLKISNSK